MRNTLFFFLFNFLFFDAALAQHQVLDNIEQGKYGQVSGSFQMDGAYYLKDSLINASSLPQKFGFNGYGNLTYNLGHFTMGFRYEAYLPTLIGIDPSYNGQGIPMRFASYKTNKFSITVGNFYEQFGGGLSLRTWWEPLLGYDNVMDGLQVHGTPFRGIHVKGVIGRQRRFFNYAGLVRGGDLELDFAEMLDTLWKSKARIRIGGSMVSKYQGDEDPVYQLPENVATFAGRLNFSLPKFRFDAEYAYKVNDPSANNLLIYRPGQALVVSASYFTSRLGVTVAAKRLDNMDFRSDRYESGQNLQINYLPPLAKQHTYRLPSLYTYATQPNGEMGLQVDVLYTFPAGSTLGGKYGTNIQANFAMVHGIDTTRLPGERNYGYESSFFGVSKKRYYLDANIEIIHKWSKKVKSTLTAYYIEYDKDKILGLTGYGVVKAFALVAENSFKIRPKHTLRTEIQWMHTKQDYGSWFMLLAEYTISPHWFLAVSDEFNYGNENPDKRLHYYAVNAGYIKGGLRISAGYGRQRPGIICVGGICRTIPATNGFTISISQTF